METHASLYIHFHKCYLPGIIMISKYLVVCKRVMRPTSFTSRYDLTPNSVHSHTISLAKVSSPMKTIYATNRVLILIRIKQRYIRETRLMWLQSPLKNYEGSRISDFSRNIVPDPSTLAQE